MGLSRPGIPRSHDADGMGTVSSFRFTAEYAASSTRSIPSRRWMIALMRLRLHASCHSITTTQNAPLQQRTGRKRAREMFCNDLKDEVRTRSISGTIRLNMQFPTILSLFSPRCRNLERILEAHRSHSTTYFFPCLQLAVPGFQWVHVMFASIMSDRLSSRPPPTLLRLRWACIVRRPPTSDHLVPIVSQ